MALNITIEEKLMYEVMKSVYDSGIPISFKGSMVLKACLFEAGYADEIRHTVDIDANWNSETLPTSKQIEESLQKALDKCGLDLQVRLYREYAEKRSAGFELIERSTEEVLFTMDIDVNRPAPPTKTYEVEGMRFCGASPLQMISDKVAAISTGKVFRRIKDVVDLYYISKAFEFKARDVRATIKSSQRELGNFEGFLYCLAELQHSYEKFRFEGGVNKPSFEEVYQSVKAYIKSILPEEKS